MKKFLSVIILISLIATSRFSYAQNEISSPSKVYRIAIFAPLYLDSVFNNSVLRSDYSIPRFIVPAVDFVQGAKIALDTLNLNGNTAEAYIYDSKSFTQPVYWLIKYNKLDDIDLIIGSVKDPEYHELADFAKKKNIPFVSATYPNDGGITANPNLIIVNSTLKAHCEGIFSYLLQKHGTDNVYLIMPKGEDRIEKYFRTFNYSEGRPLLNMKTIVVDSTISSYSLLNRIDSTHPAVIIGASLDEVFAKSVAEACYPIQKNHTISLIGMPNWDGFKSLYNKNEFKDFPIHYTSPHFDTENNMLDSILIKKYFQLYRTKPSDMAYKGFGITWYFVKLLLHYPGNIMDHLNDTLYSAFHDYNFKPVFNDTQKKKPDYYENKHLFIMEILNAEILKEW